ncbi:MAG: 50S ribosomal protein L14 [Cytophagales bacterium]|nr:50S ribosomal protein L14 [Cytophagales bacterium]
MIRSGTRVVVADNTGAKVAACIMILYRGCKRAAEVGDRIKVAVKSVTPGGTVKKGDVCLAVIIRTTKEIRRSSGECVRFSDNAVVLINEGGGLKGSRVFGPVARELKNGNYSDIVSAAKELL